MQEQPKQYRAMNSDEWVLLIIFTYLRGIYLKHGWGGVVVGVVVGAIPFLGIAVWAYGLIAMHEFFGCTTSLKAFGFWVGVAAVLSVIVLVLS